MICISELKSKVFLPLHLMAEVISIEDFVQLHRDGRVAFDARSPGEFEHGRIPGALSLPLLNNDERAQVGTIYKQKGHDAAVLKGFDLVGGKFGDYIRKAKELSKEKQVTLYCWRGGMRSNIMAWLLEKGGFHVTLIRGGYKSYRRWALSQLAKNRNIVIVGGMTGSGKTDLLLELERSGEQVIDLEGLAHHKGSAFGALGQKPQPTIEQFENELALRWHKLDADKITWIENESRSIGSMIVPAHVYELMCKAPMIEVLLDRKKRSERILNEYGSFSKEVLIANTKKLEKRLGGLRLKEALEKLESGLMTEWVDIMLDYYDGLYRYGIEQREGKAVHKMVVEFDDIRTDALMMKQLADRIVFAGLQTEEK